MKTLFCIAVILLANSAFADDYRIKGPAPIVVTPGAPPSNVYGQDLNRIIEIQKVPEVKPYVGPKYEPIVVEDYKAPKLEDYR